jgi:hypothetical protein
MNHPFLKSPYGWLALTAVLAAGVGLIIGFNRSSARTPVQLSPEQERFAGVNSAKMAKLGEMKQRFRGKSPSEQDWAEVQQVLLEGAPAGLSLGLSSLGVVAGPEAQARALNVLNEYVKRQNSDASLHPMVQEVLLQIRDRDGEAVLRAFIGKVGTDERLRRIGADLFQS